MANGEVRPPAVRPQGPAQSSAGGFGVWARSHVPFLIVALLVVGIGGYLWYKHEKNKNSTATTTGTDLLTSTESGDLDTIASNTTAEVQAINQLYGALVSTTPVPPTTIATAPSSPTSPTNPNPPTTNTGPPSPPVIGGSPPAPVTTTTTQPGQFTAAQAATTLTSAPQGVPSNLGNSGSPPATPPAPVTTTTTQPGYFTAAQAATTLTSAPQGVPSNLGISGYTAQTGVEPTLTSRVTPPTSAVKTAGTVTTGPSIFTATQAAKTEVPATKPVTKPTKAAPKQTYTNAQELTAL